MTEQFVNGADTVLLLAFATVLLNTDLHNDCIRPESKMTVDQFVHNLRGKMLTRGTDQLTLIQSHSLIDLMRYIVTRASALFADTWYGFTPLFRILDP